MVTPSPRTVRSCFDSWLLEPKLDSVAKNYRWLPKIYQLVSSSRWHKLAHEWRPGDPGSSSGLAWVNKIKDLKGLLELCCATSVESRSMPWSLWLFPHQNYSGPYAKFQKPLSALDKSIPKWMFSGRLRIVCIPSALAIKGDRRWSHERLSNERWRESVSPSTFLGRSQQTFSVKGQTVHILGFQSRL